MVVDEMDAQVRAPIATIVATAQDSKLQQQMHYVRLVFRFSLFIFSLWRTLNSFFFLKVILFEREIVEGIATDLRKRHINIATY